MNKLLLLEIPCPLCLESKSALMQTFSGVFLPLILVPLGNFSVSDKILLSITVFYDIDTLLISFITSYI